MRRLERLVPKSPMGTSIHWIVFSMKGTLDLAPTPPFHPFSPKDSSCRLWVSLCALGGVIPGWAKGRGAYGMVITVRVEFKLLAL